MAETPSKRLHAAETFDFDESSLKRQKPYNCCILSLLDEEEESEEQNQDLSAIFTTLQQELSSSSSTTTSAAFDFDSPTEDNGAQTAEEDEGVKSVMRHLLEASDDELGIPNNEENINLNNNNNVEIEYDEIISLNYFDNGLWEFDDVAAYYHTILQSELLM